MASSIASRDLSWEGTWSSRAAALGLDSLWRPRIDHDGALAVFRTPREWLLAERAGVVLVDPDRAWLTLRDADLLFNRPRTRIVVAASAMPAAE